MTEIATGKVACGVFFFVFFSILKMSSVDFMHERENIEHAGKFSGTIHEQIIIYEAVRLS